MSTNRPDYFKTLKQVLEGRLFRIPKYQRVYSWRKKERTALWNDIVELFSKNSDRHHFMATIVCLQTDEKRQTEAADILNVFDVVDGQQRLTTLVIILKVLEKYISNNKVSQKISELLIKTVDQRLVLLQTNHSSYKIFEDYIISGVMPDKKKAKDFASKNLIEAFDEIESNIQSFSGDKVKLYTLVMNRIDFIFHVLDDESTVYTVFEVLNSRGLEVDWFDKFKSTLMGMAFDKFTTPDAKKEKINSLHDEWGNIYGQIGLDNTLGEEILRYAGTLYRDDASSKVLSAEEAIKVFVEAANSDSNEIMQIAKWMSKVAKSLSALRNDRRVAGVTRISHARLLAVAIELSSFGNKEKEYLKTIWELVTFRIFGLLRKDSRTKIGEYVRLAHTVYNTDSKSVSDIATGLYNLLKKLSKDGIYKDDDNYSISKINETIKEEDCYNGWANELRYLLYCYEEFHNPQNIKNIDWTLIWNEEQIDKTIEHIWPQKARKGDWPTIDKDDCLHYLGNLTLLTSSLNSEAGNNSFEVKKTNVYPKSNLYLTKSIEKYKKWTIKEIDKREKEILEWAISYWSDENIEEICSKYNKPKKDAKK